MCPKEIFIGDGSSGTTSRYSKEKDVKTETAKDKEVVDDKQSNIVTSLAEKAMSVAAPIVPTKEGGEVDQERLSISLVHLLPLPSSFVCFLFSLLFFIFLGGCSYIILLDEQACCNAGRTGAERWGVKTGWQVSFTMGRPPWCYELNRSDNLIFPYC